jgi:hypothetical protein
VIELGTSQSLYESDLIARKIFKHPDLHILRVVSQKNSNNGLNKKEEENKIENTIGEAFSFYKRDQIEQAEQPVQEFLQESLAGATKE